MVRQSIARSAVLRRLRTKTAAKPLRPRVETYAFTEDGKIIAGKYPDGSVGVFGGGVDGDSLETAAKKEYREEGGRTLKSVEKIKGVKPLTKKWNDDPTVGSSPKHKKRMEQFSGSKTIFMTGEVGGKAKVVDGHKLKGVRAYTVEELIKAQKKSLKSGDKEMEDIKRARLSVLERLREKTASSLDELKTTTNAPKDAIYAPEIYGHEAGHSAYRKRMGRFGKALDAAATVGGIGGFGMTIGGIASENPALAAGGALLGAASSVPRLAEETAASRHSLRELKSQLSPEEYKAAKKRLTAAGSTYYLTPATQALAAGTTLAGAATNNAPLLIAGGIGTLAAPLVSLGGMEIAKRRMADPAGKRMTADEIRELHKQMAPDLALNLSAKPWEGGAFFMPKQTGRFGKWIGNKMLKDEELEMDEPTRKAFLEQGGIHMAKSWTPKDLIRMSMKGSKPEKIEKALAKYEEKMRKKEEKRKAKAER